jgi:hypothetical protein
MKLTVISITLRTLQRNSVQAKYEPDLLSSLTHKLIGLSMSCMSIFI